MRYHQLLRLIPATAMLMTFGFATESEDHRTFARFDEVALVESLTSEEQALVDWATGRFAQAGLELPEVTVRFDPTRELCKGAEGLYRHGPNSERVVTVCTPDFDTFAARLNRRRTLLHEFGHAWDFANMSVEDRHEVGQILGVDAWNDPDDVWKDRGVERLAETFVFALLDQPRRQLKVSLECSELLSAFRTATRAEPLGPGLPPCAAGDGEPDRVGDFVGGVAARVRFDDGEPIPGDLFLLMALDGSDANARVYDRARYPFDGGQTDPETIESNRQAVRTVEGISGTDLQTANFTAAPGGGPSAGVTYAIAYLNIVSDGAFTGDLVVASTGRLGSHGYVHPINAIDEKTAAANLAGADVLFTPSIPAAALVEVHGTRVVGEMHRARNTGTILREERLWNHYDSWGRSRPTNDMDVVGIRHLGDVAAYLCGAGSDFACDITGLLENAVTNTSPATNDFTPFVASLAPVCTRADAIGSREPDVEQCPAYLIIYSEIDKARQERDQVPEEQGRTAQIVQEEIDALWPKTRTSPSCNCF